MIKTRNGILILLLVGVAYFLVINESWRAAIGGAAETVVRPILIPLVNVILEPAFVYTTAVALFLAGLLACVMFWLKVVRPELAKLRILRSEITRLALPRNQDPGPRFEAMKRLGDLLRRESMFLSAWALFQGQFVQSQRISEQPFSYLVAEEPAESGADRRGFMSALPGYFTSVGLILTFVGLVVALYFAAKGFRSGNLEQARQAILQLLNASAFKFITSVAALATALLVSIFYRFCLSLLRSDRNRTVATIEAYISIWRDLEIASLTPIWKPADEIAAKMDVLTEAILKLNTEIGHLADLLATSNDARVTDGIGH
jgi:hypothetical protein